MELELLNSVWTLGEKIGSGGFGEVYRAENSQNKIGAIKLIPKDRGAQRDLLAADLSGVSNVIPIIDQGETDDAWVIAMPLAEKSLHDYIDECSGKLSIDDTMKLAKDIASSLRELDGRIVHRDIKPQNILLLDGQWCLTDFGISRYAEATTASDTQKFALSAPYAAPERWRSIRATTATDVYSLGVIIYEAIAGRRPFTGPNNEDYREQHLNNTPEPLKEVEPVLSSLILECLYKAPETRPSPATLLKRLELREATSSATGGLAALQQANQQQVEAKIAVQEETSKRDQLAQSRGEIADVARKEFEYIAQKLKHAITANAPSAEVIQSSGQEWRILLGNAQLDLNRLESHEKNDWGKWEPPAMDVIAFSSIDITMPVNSLGYEGRGHSLWYCDPLKSGEFGWYEVAFMVSAVIPRAMMGTNGGVRDPFQLGPGVEAAKALWHGMAEFQLARPFILLKDDAVDEFISRWANYLAFATSGNLNRPSTMPEVDPNGSWK